VRAARTAASSPIRPGVAHLQKAADVPRAGCVEERCGRGGVPVPRGLSRTVALEQAQRDEAVEEVDYGPGPQVQRAGQLVGRAGTGAQGGEQAKLDRGQQRLGRPESHPNLHDQ